MKTLLFSKSWIFLLALMVLVNLAGTGTVLGQNPPPEAYTPIEQPDNTSPIANPDVYTIAADTTLIVDAAHGVLANDYDADGDMLTALFKGDTAFGDLTFYSDGSFVYTPDTGYTGADHFTYRAFDGLAQTEPVLVTINVTGGDNTAPVAVEDSYLAVSGTTLTVDAAGGVLKNDYDAEGDILSAVLIGVGTAFGNLTFNANGSFVYTPDLGYAGADHFAYQASDGVSTSNIVVVTITVTAGDDTAPVAFADTYNTLLDTPLIVDAASGLLANDQDADGDVLTVTLVGGVSFGSLDLHPDGSFTYTPNAGYTGADHFTYEAYDGLLVSNPVMVTINVNTLDNAVPMAVPDTYSMVVDTPLEVAAPGVLANDLDADGDILTAEQLGLPPVGTLMFHSDGSFEYLPPVDFVGSVIFTYWTSDGLANSAPAIVTILVTFPRIYLPMLTK